MTVLLTLMMTPPFDAFDIDYAVFSVSAYVDDPMYGNVAASGALLREGDCACGPGYPFGTIFVLPDRVVICRDRGGAITDGHIDIWTDDLRWALDVWGRRRLPAIVIRNGGENDLSNHGTQ